MPKCKSIKRLIPATCAWCILFATTILFFLFPCRKLIELGYHYTLVIAQGVITYFVIFNFTCTTFFDPGIIKRADPDEDKDDFHAPLYKEVLVENQPIRMKWCSTCQFYRPPRCSHCSVCDYCIETFDHHCPWVNNCIGRRNYRHFFFFLIFLSIDMLTCFFWCMVLIQGENVELKETAAIVSISLMVLILFLTIPVFGLTLFHVVLVARGRTTNEQVTNKFHNAPNPFSRGVLYNCLYTLCGPRFPGLPKSNNSAVEEFIESGNAVKVYNDNIPLDVSNRNTDSLSYHYPSGKSDTNDIMLQRLDSQPSSLRSEPHFQSMSHSSSRNHREEFHSHSSPDDSLGYSGGAGTTKATIERHVVTMQHGENGTKETTFIALPSSNLEKDSLDHSAGMFPYYNNKISASPLKSSSINELSSHLKKSPTRRQQNYGAGGSHNDGGMVIFYSPDAGCISSTSGKYNSETQLQRYKSSSSPTATTVVTDYNSGGCGSVSTTTTTASGYNSELRFEQSNDNISRRPLPFLKALEMTNKIETSSGGGGGSKIVIGKKDSSENVRQNQYEMSYEISV